MVLKCMVPWKIWLVVHGKEFVPKLLQAQSLLGQVADKEGLKTLRMMASCRSLHANHKHNLAKGNPVCAQTSL